VWREKEDRESRQEPKPMTGASATKRHESWGEMDRNQKRDLEKKVKKPP